MEGSGALTFQVPSGAEGRCTTVANIPLPSGGFAVSFLLVPSGQNSYITLESMKLAVELTVQAGRLLFQVNGGGVMPYASVQYDPLAMRYLRLTPDASTHAITAAYSKDAVTWTDLSGTAPLTTAPASVDILIKAGELVAGEASAAKFAHLIACP